MADRSATPKATAWWAVSGLPNDSREVTNSIVASRQPRASPAVAAGPGADVAGVRAAGRLGQAEGAERLARRHTGQVLGPQVLRGEVVEQRGRDGLHVHRDGQRRVDDGELLGGDAHAAQVGPGA